ncbi:MAG TPA: ribonuclease HII [Gammaproteobacteria bacterium]|nr:ribonuclease HII [Gammaproteobacteria bacterium]
MEIEWIAGVDEAGRGPLAGPVMAAVVVLDPARPVEGLADSKQLTPEQRDELYPQITATALAWAVAHATVDEIDNINILQATLLAMKRAVASLPRLPARALIDGNRCPQLDCATESIVKGDALVPAISAASILAKVTRDRWMVELHRQYPQYGFDRHKGYSTAEHIESLERHGPCPQHRRSFEPVARLLQGRIAFG